MIVYEPMLIFTSYINVNFFNNILYFTHTVKHYVCKFITSILINLTIDLIKLLIYDSILLTY